jgi:hypothetical protein
MLSIHHSTIKSNSWATMLSSFSISLILAIALLSVACDDEPIPDPPPPNLPKITQAELSCSLEQGQYVLSSASFTVQDYDGIDTLLEPYAEVMSIVLSFNQDLIPADTMNKADDEDNTEMGESEEDQPDCKSDSCEAIYSWQRNTEQESPILCGESGKDLSMMLRITDQDAHSVSVTVLSNPRD